MRSDLIEYSDYVCEFLNADTLNAIDYGTLDLGYIKNYELKKVLMLVELILTVELESNYMNNNTGFFRVHKKNELWYYVDFGYVIKSSSLLKLKETVISQNRIWYVFDEKLALNSLRR